MPQHIQLSQKTQFLEDLPPSIPRYAYNGIDQFREIMSLERERFERSNDSKAIRASSRLTQDRRDRQYLHSMHQRPRYHILHDNNEPTSQLTSELKNESPNQSTTESTNGYVLFEIKERDIRTDFLDRIQATNLSLRLSFDFKTSLLLVKMMGPVHSEMQSRFNDMITFALTAMGLQFEFQNYSGVTIRGDDSGKEADWGWGPAAGQPGHTGKPTVSLEVAVSESQAKLERDVRWWLSPTKGRANLTVTINVNRRAPSLTIDIWQWVDIHIQRTQQVTIAKVDGQVFVTGDPLTIPFDLLFLRQPTAGSAESDVILHQQALVPFADSVWRVQGFT
ncbi:hypothetical protein N7507_002460 [Penicillium longicatenatum]|nr:hypothetical protein N7507_002460 [Penicillium longicatenatum]